MAQTQLWQECICWGLVNTVAHDKKLTRSWRINRTNQVKHSGLTTTWGSSDHHEFTPIWQKSFSLRTDALITIMIHLLLNWVELRLRGERYRFQSSNLLISACQIIDLWQIAEGDHILLALKIFGWQSIKVKLLSTILFGCLHPYLLIHYSN